MTPRNAWVDAARGAALLPMMVFHFAWDLSTFGMIETQIAADPFWMWLARLTAGSFLFVSGIGLALGARAGVAPRAYLRRIGVIAAAAALVSIATFIYLPGFGVFFGILHAIALGSLLAWPLLRAPGWLVGALAAAAFTAPLWAAHEFFNAPVFWWTGLSLRVAPSADYIPILPWIAPMLAGLLLGRAIPMQAGPAPRWLTWPGRHTLAIYLLHQPVLIGGLLAVQPLLTPSPQAIALEFNQAFLTDCRNAGQPDAVCAIYAGCATSRLEPLLAAAHRKRMTLPQREEWTRVLEACEAEALRPR